MPDPSSLEYWVDLINSRNGHGGVFATANTSGVTELVERGIAEEFADALAHTDGLLLSDVISNSDDPPDCFATVDDRMIGIELVELVDAKALAKAKKGHSPFKNSGQFLETQWDRNRFVDKVNALIDAKHHKYKVKSHVFDCLLIYTAEPWLLPNDVTGWLDETTFDPRASFKSTYLLMSYDPSHSQQHWPLFNVYGRLE